MAVEPASVQPLRVGIVGLGWAGQTHLKAYLQLPQVQVLALAGLEEDRLAALGAEHDVPHLYREWGDLLARDDLDVVSVCTPNHLHAPVAIAALEGGRHVLCEKPLARTAAEGEAIVEAAVAARRVLQVAFNHRARDDVQVLRRYIESGGLGRIYHVKANWLRRSGIPTLGSWFTSREMAGGGPLIDIGVHILDIALHLLDEPDPLTVSAATYAELGTRGRGNRDERFSRSRSGPKTGSTRDFEVEDLATAFIRLAGGATMILETGWAVYGGYGDDFDITLYGTEGGAAITVKGYGWEDTLRIYTDLAGVPAEVRPRVGPSEGHQKVVRDFVGAIRGGDWSAHVGLEGLRRTRVIDACYASAREGREVTVGQSGGGAVGQFVAG